MDLRSSVELALNGFGQRLEASLSYGFNVQVTPMRGGVDASSSSASASSLALPPSQLAFAGVSRSPQDPLVLGAPPHHPPPPPPPMRHFPRSLDDSLPPTLSPIEHLSVGVPQYKMSSKVMTIPELWREWTVGLGFGCPPIETLDREYGTAWRDASDRQCTAPGR